MDRRKFLKLSTLSFAALGSPLFAKTEERLYIKLPPKNMKHYHIKGKQKGGRVLIIGGIHGNEIGAYKCADMLVESDILKGEMLIIPRSNFTSILADVRGYNGDMNRKFEYISKKDPDYYNVEHLKEAILSYRPDVVISMHDGFGFAIENNRAWGQSVVIDELQYKNFNLYQKALYVKNEANKLLKRKLAIINTKTFTGTIHKEQKKALTGWCLQHGIEAYCIEASKQLSSVYDKVYTHFAMLKQFFKLYNIEIKNLDNMMDNIDNYLQKEKPVLTLNINGIKHRINKIETLKLKKGSFIEVEISGGRGDYLVPRGVNLNWQSFHFGSLSFDVKRDYQKIYSIHIKRV
ncbi:M99 family carboxypeptidase catalytic domain-containing protein [Caminibacter sp.]